MPKIVKLSELNKKDREEIEEKTQKEIAERKAKIQNEISFVSKNETRLPINNRVQKYNATNIFPTINNINRNNIGQEQKNTSQKVFEKLNPESEINYNNSSKSEFHIGGILPYIRNNFIQGLSEGTAGIAQGQILNASNEAKKISEKDNKNKLKDSNDTLLQTLNPIYGITRKSYEIGQNTLNTLKDKDKTVKQKVAEILTNSVSGVKDLNNPIGDVVKLSGKTAGIINNKAGDKLLELNEKIEKPLRENREKLQEEGQNYSNVARMAGTVSNVVGNMTPSIIASRFGGGSEGLSQALSLGTMGLSAKGRATQEALNKGAELDKAIKIGDTKAMTEVGTELLTGGLNIFGKGALDNIVERGINKKVTNNVLNYLAKQGAGIVGEIGEETISDILNTIIDQGTVDPKATYSMKDWSDTALTTMLSTVVLNALGGAYTPKAYNQNVQEMEQTNAKQDITERINNSNLSEEDKSNMINYVQNEDFTQADYNAMRETIDNSQTQDIANNQERIEYLKSIDTSNMGFIERGKIKTEIRALEQGYNSIEEYQEAEKLKREQAKKEYEQRQKEKENIESQKKAQLENDIKESTPMKNAQFKIIQNTNPMLDDYHTGIRSPKDIKTFDEVINDEESFVWGDFSKEDAKKALQEGKITIYSSYPIENGVFVSTSKVQAEDYAGGRGNKVYSKDVPLQDVAWINGDEGQYAKLENNQETLYNNNESEGDIYDATRSNNQYNETEEIRENQPVLSENASTYTGNEITNELYEQNRKEVENTIKEEIKNNFGFNDEVSNDIYSKISQKENLTREDIYKAFDNHRDIVAEDVSDDVKQTVNDIKKTLRTIKINTSNLKGDIADYKDFYRRNFNRVSMGNDGIDVDVLYKELLDVYPGYFDENIINPADQLQQIVAWRDFDAEELLKPTTYTLTDNDLENIADTILNYKNYLSSIKPKNSNQSSFIMPTEENTKREVNLPLNNIENNTQNTKGETIDWNEIERPEGRFRKHYQSIVNSNQTTKEAKKIARSLMQKDVYTPISNIKTLSKANENIQKNGADNTYEAFKNKLATNEKVTLQDIATGERLIQLYSQKGDYAKVNDLIQNVAILGTELGQQVQALSLIKRASPEGQLAYLKKIVDRTNIKENTDIKVTDEMAEKILKSKNQEDLEKNISEIAEEIGSQLPLTIGDKIRSWRYLSMLGNPRTHIRNLASNIAMNLTQKVKNKVAGAGEDIVSIFNKDIERTKTFKRANKDQRNFAIKDADIMKDLIDGGGKYDIKNIVQSTKKSFNNKLLNKIAEFNTNALDTEDKVFLKTAYKQAMQNYMRANNLSSSDMEGKVLQKAREYASVQAQEATFHQFNSLANAISNLERKNKTTNFAVGAILPFKKTPLNIAKSGLEYSPLNIARSIGGTIKDITKTTNEYKEQLKKGNINQEEYNTATSKLVTDRIDQMAKGLTGTSIALIGYALAKSGILKAGNDGDDDKFEEKLGNQEYSIKIGNNTYTLDWVSPSAIPLFIGSTIYKMITSNDNDEKSGAINSVVTGLAKSFEPMTEMSMLQGLTNAITSYERDSSNMIFDLMASAGQSYLGQFVPTALGQVTKTIDPNIRDTSSTKKGVEKRIDQLKKQTMSKIPGLSNMLPTKTDIWGNDRKREENVAERYIRNAILPYNKENIKDDKVSNELVNVYNDTGEASILPTTIDKNLTINKQKYTMTSDEYAKYKKQYGETSYNLLKNLVNSEEYKSMSSDKKQMIINNIYKYAKEQVKVDYARHNKLDNEESSLSIIANILKKSGESQNNYFEYLAKIKDVNKDKEKLEILINSSYTNKVKQIIYENSIGQDDSLYNVMKLVNINTNEYLKYKSQDFESDRIDDGTLKGESKKNKKDNVVQYLKSMNITDKQRLLLYASQGYSTSNSQKKELVNYISNLDMNLQDKLELFSKFSGFEVYKNGQIKY